MLMTQPLRPHDRRRIISGYNNIFYDSVKFVFAYLKNNPWKGQIDAIPAELDCARQKNLAEERHSSKSQQLRKAN